MQAEIEKWKVISCSHFDLKIFNTWRSTGKPQHIATPLSGEFGRWSVDLPDKRDGKWAVPHRWCELCLRGWFRLSSRCSHAASRLVQFHSFIFRKRRHIGAATFMTNGLVLLAFWLGFALPVTETLIMANATDVLLRFILRMAVSMEDFRELLDLVIDVLRETSQYRRSYQVQPEAFLRGCQLSNAGRVIDVRWSFRHVPLGSLTSILSTLNVYIQESRFGKGLSANSCLAVFSLGAHDSDFVLRFGAAQCDSVEESGLWHKGEVSLTPVAQSFKHDFTCNAMRGRKLCKDCWFFPELKQPSAFGTCVACDFLVGLEDAFSQVTEESFLREMDRLLPGWQDPRGLQRKFLSRTLSNSELGIVADNIAAFVFPAGHKLDVLMNWRDWPNAFRSVQCTAALGAMKQVVRCIDFHCELRPSFVEPTPNKFTYTVYPFLRV